MGVLHFSVSGEFITRFARERFCETGDVQTGIDILIKALNGFPEDLAREVVKGKEIKKTAIKVKGIKA